MTLPTQWVFQSGVGSPLETWLGHVIDLALVCLFARPILVPSIEMFSSHQPLWLLVQGLETNGHRSNKNSYIY